MHGPKSRSSHSAALYKAWATLTLLSVHCRAPVKTTSGHRPSLSQLFIQSFSSHPLAHLLLSERLVGAAAEGSGLGAGGGFPTPGHKDSGRMTHTASGDAVTGSDERPPEPSRPPGAFWGDSSRQSCPQTWCHSLRTTVSSSQLSAPSLMQMGKLRAGGGVWV